MFLGDNESRSARGVMLRFRSFFFAVAPNSINFLKLDTFYKQLSTWK